jgi:ankyrin repeat protein
MIAVLEGHTIIVRLLLDIGADIKIQTDKYETPLYYAAAKGHRSVVWLLFKKGISTSATCHNICQYILLYGAVIFEHEGIVRILLESGAKINPRGEGKDTALHLAATVGNEATVWVLLEGGAEIEAKCRDTLTPLYFAIHHEHEAVVSLLLSAGADPGNRGRAERAQMKYRGWNRYVREIREVSDWMRSLSRSIAVSLDWIEFMLARQVSRASPWFLILVIVEDEPA